MWRWRFTSEPHEKLPVSSLSALNLKLPPLTRTRRTVTLEDNLVLPGWRPNSYLQSCNHTWTVINNLQLLTSLSCCVVYTAIKPDDPTHFLFFLHLFCLPPVSLRLCRESREIPARRRNGSGAVRRSREILKTPV